MSLHGTGGYRYLTPGDNVYKGFEDNLDVAENYIRNKEPDKAKIFYRQAITAKNFLPKGRELLPSQLDRLNSIRTTLGIEGHGDVGNIESERKTTRDRSISGSRHKSGKTSTSSSKTSKKAKE